MSISSDRTTEKHVITGFQNNHSLSIRTRGSVSDGCVTSNRHRTVDVQIT